MHDGGLFLLCKITNILTANFEERSWSKNGTEIRLKIAGIHHRAFCGTPFIREAYCNICVVSLRCSGIGAIPRVAVLANRPAAAVPPQDGGYQGRAVVGPPGRTAVSQPAKKVSSQTNRKESVPVKDSK
jgi:hypothetical protein